MYAVCRLGQGVGFTDCNKHGGHAPLGWPQHIWVGGVGYFIPLTWDRLAFSVGLEQIDIRVHITKTSSPSKRVCSRNKTPHFSPLCKCRSKTICPDVHNCAFIFGLSSRMRRPTVGNISTLADLFCSRSAMLEFTSPSLSLILSKYFLKLFVIMRPQSTVNHLASTT
jgi:hypothetical protein